MRKLLTAVVSALILSTPALAGTDDYQAGLLKGIEVGVDFCKQATKQELMSVWSLIDASLSYRELMIAGEIPPPLAVEQTVLERQDGVAILKREIKFYPPAYFPVDKIQELREDLLISRPIVIPKGWAVITKTDRLPLKKIAYYAFLAQTDGSDPIYDKQSEVLYYDSFARKSDAVARARELKSIGLPAEVVELENDVVIKEPDKLLPLAAEIKAMAQKIAQKEARIVGLPPHSFKKGLQGVIYYLQKAIVAADTIDTRRYPFEVGLLKSDLQTIMHNLQSYLRDRQPYRKVFSSSQDPYAQKGAEKKYAGSGKAQPPTAQFKPVKSKLDILKEKLRKLREE